MSEKEFYIGWMPAAPHTLVKHLRKVLLFLLIVAVLAGVVLAISQKKFGSGNFEFGTLTTVKGIYYEKPVPMLKVVNGSDLFGNLSYITVPLVGFGKMGADGIMTGLAREKNIALDKKEITIKGTLLYNDGKLLMQVDAGDAPLLSAGQAADPALLPVQENLGQQTLTGEIVDPKCYFGVMKPGQGKPHKDCAIRCILGGIPPVLRVHNEKGEANYYLIAGPDGEKMNQAVKDFVAEPVSLTARVVRYDDWIVLYVNDNGIKRYSYLQAHYNNKVQVCAAACNE